MWSIKRSSESYGSFTVKWQNFALEFIKKLVLAWDADYTKVTAAERKVLEEAKKT